MADAMVTARMSQEKKDEGNRVLAQLGVNASQAVNRLYDYVLERRELPFPEMDERRKYTDEEIARAMEWVDGISRLAEGDRHMAATDDETGFRHMGIKEAKRARLVKKGLMQAGGER